MKLVAWSAAALGSLLIANTAMAAEAAGDWHGALSVQGQTLHMALHLKKTASGYEGTADSLDQGAMGIALADIASDGSALSFSMPSVGGTYKAKWDDAKKEWTGTWSQSGYDIPLDFMPGPAAAQ